MPLNKLIEMNVEELRADGHVELVEGVLHHEVAVHLVDLLQQRARLFRERGLILARSPGRAPGPRSRDGSRFFFFLILAVTGFF